MVTGHYDSRNTDVSTRPGMRRARTTTGPGWRSVLELARVFASRPTGATIIFAAVAGEEQGLFGSAFLAAQIKAAGTDVQAMFSNDIVGASDAYDGTPARPAHGAAVRRGRADLGDGAAGRDPAGRGRRGRRAVAANWRGSSERRGNYATGMRCG